MTTTRTMGWGRREVTFREVGRASWAAARGALSVEIMFDHTTTPPWSCYAYALHYKSRTESHRVEAWRSAHDSLEGAIAYAWGWLVKTARMTKSKEG